MALFSKEVFKKRNFKICVQSTIFYNLKIIINYIYFKNIYREYEEKKYKKN